MFRETKNKNATDDNDESQIFNDREESFHQQKRQEKDISEYSDSELFQMLDLNNPTDRELEAKLYSLIDKYTDIKDKMGQKLKKFYTSIFDHFFENEDDENNSTSSLLNEEGFQDVLDSNNENIKYTKNIDYTKGSLNPILKETIKRVVSIDSSFRETTTYPYTTDFTFNLSETLRDVVSLKLYSVHIPYNWYTISKNYGSNFIYIKGVANGINNGNYDYKISVPYGNYNSNTLVTALNSSFQTIKDNNRDVSFGTSSINYNSINGKCDITLDIKNNYNETNYYVQFPPDVSGVTNTTVSGEKILKNMREIFGYQKHNYYPFNVNSELFITADDNSLYLLDSSNNYFDVHIYGTSINPTDHTISSYANNGDDVTHTTIKILLSLTTNNFYSQNEIVNDLNNQLSNNQYLLQSNDNENPTSQISTKMIEVNDISNSYYCLSIRPNRRLISNVQNQKMAIEFPDESYKNTNSLWTGPTSCFKFKTYIMEFQNIYGEIQSPTTTYIVNSTPLPYVFLKCTKEGYDTSNNDTEKDTSYNDYRIDISNSPLSGYTLNDYVSVINSSMTNLSRNTNGMISCSMNYNNDKKYDISANINYIIDVTNFKIVIKNKWLLTQLYGATNEINEITISGEKDYMKQNTFEFKESYEISYNDIFTIISCGDKNKDVSAVDVSFSSTPTRKNISTIVNAFNSSITHFNANNANNNNIKFKSPYVLSYVVNNNYVTLTLTIDVNAILTNADYKLMIETNLQNTFGFKESYDDLANINGQNQLGSNLLALDNSNNFLYIKPMYDVSGGVYTNNNDNVIKITLDLDLQTTTQYTKEQVRDSMNRVLAKNPMTKGSYINTDNPTTLFRLNVNKTFSAKDYSIVFFDSTSFTRCNFGQNSSIETTTVDTTLGWILGFRSNTIYYPTLENLNKDNINDVNYYGTYSNEYAYDESNGIIKLSGDTSVNVNLYNYFLIVLDDYTQNHLNDGLVTTINADTDVPLPSYASKVNYKCDPETGSVVISNIYNSTNYNSLTNAQIYSANQILNAQQQKSAKNIQSSGPFIQDIFGLIPVKINGLSYGQTYTEFGGTLQIQERIYFGPVNIRRMTVKLMSDKGNVLDLNGQNWSFSLIAEQLYNPNKG